MYAGLGREPHHHPAHVADWLHRHAGALIAHPAGPDAVEEILVAVRQARWATDAPPRDLVYAGPCDMCEADLYARPNAVTVACRWCVDDEGQRLRYDVHDRREWMLRKAEDLTAPAVRVSSLARMLGVKVGDSTVYEWAKKGLILTRGRDERGRMLYRLGDVVEVALNTKQARRKAS
ncbi:hypothetical protein AB0L65_33010 [Nonomuraea sp. NPDC052116]|uniref:hypothetical protein n=1 Tax=Nonomuraea sp. NPDC052116 TaxID=3155665 RepID=UPI003442B63B